MLIEILFALLVGTFGRFSEDYRNVPNNAQNLYDYIIVGGGGAGAVLANKLSANGAKTLLLEQGDNGPCACDQDYPFNLDVSQPYIKPFFPTKQGFAVNRSNPLYEFTGLGGSTRIYGATYTRASKQFLDNKFPVGYKYDDLLPYYKQNEDHYCHYLLPLETGISFLECQQWHGKNGAMQISPPPYLTVGLLSNTMLQTAANLPGFGKTDDYNGNPSSRSGLAYAQQFRSRTLKYLSSSSRKTESTYSAFLPDSVRASRPNLAIETSARVIDLLFQQFSTTTNAKRVRGVEYLSKGKTLKQAWARQKVFVSGGVISTPKILQLAGVGPASLLQSVGVSVVADNAAIGANLRAHQGYFQTFKVTLPTPPPGLPVTVNYWNAIQGHISSGYGGSTELDVQLELLEGVVTPYINVEISGTPLEMTAAPPPWPLFEFVVSSMNSNVTGSVKIQSDNVLADPAFDLGWTDANFQSALLGGRDLPVLLATMKKIRSLVNAEPFKTLFQPQELEIQKYKDMALLGFPIGSLPPLDVLNDMADTLYLKYSLTHIYHVTSSVSLGDATDLTGAVKGVKGLYVCDNSLLPANPDANPTATMIAVCSKIAQLALADSSSSGSDPWWAD